MDAPNYDEGLFQRVGSNWNKTKSKTILKLLCKGSRLISDLDIYYILTFLNCDLLLSCLFLSPGERQRQMLRYVLWFRCLHQGSMALWKQTLFSDRAILLLGDSSGDASWAQQGI